MSTEQESNRNHLFPMFIIGLLFFIFGFVTWLNGSLIPFLKIICDLNDFQALFVTFAFYIAYTFMALPMAFVLERTGYRDGMALGLLIMAVGSILFIPAAYSASFMLFLAALFILGSGLTILQTASNPYLVLLGSNESAAMRISIMGLINKGAGVLVPLVFTALVLGDISDSSQQALLKLSSEETQSLADRLVRPYIYMTITLLLLATMIKLTKLPEFQQPSEMENASGILQFPQVVLGAIALFAYVGVEVIAGDTIGLFGGDLGLHNIASLTSYTMMFMVIGYLIGIFFIPKYLAQKSALVGSAIAGILCVFGILLSSPESNNIAGILWGWTGIPLIPNPVTFVAMMGLAHALVWPSVWPLALKNLGRFTPQGSALLIMGIAGGAILPLIFGKLAQTSQNMQSAYWVALPCYLFILFYAIKGHKIRTWRSGS